MVLVLLVHMLLVILEEILLTGLPPHMDPPLIDLHMEAEAVVDIPLMVTMSTPKQLSQPRSE